MPILVKDGRPALGRLLLLVGAVAAVVLGTWLIIGLCPVTFTAVRATTIEIPYGTGTTRLAGLLDRRGLVRDPLVFRIWAVLTGNDRAVKAGTYALAPDMSVPRILGVLTSGRELTVRITIPEGATLQDIAVLLDANGVAARESFLACAGDRALIHEVAPDAGGYSLEGFLFPDTYFFTNAAGAEEAIRLMAGRFKQAVTDGMRAHAQAMGRSLREVVIIASLVEREAKRPEDRPKIAAVFYNRLRAGIALQSCATVQYALGRHKDRLLYEDLHIVSPYNTYLYRGLPPGPICNAGLDSIRAALYPAPERYLYFVARPDGTHVFSETYREHLRAQREIDQQR